jgi:rubrerythrin
MVNLKIQRERKVMNESTSEIGIREKRVVVELKGLRQVVKLLKTQRGMSLEDITKVIEFRIADALNSGYSIPYESFKKLQAISEEYKVNLQVKKSKYRTHYNRSSMEKLARIVGMKKTGVAGKFLSEEYAGMNASSRWQCGKCGRIWTTNPSAIMYRGDWCVRCSGRETWSYKKMIDLAKKRGLEKTGFLGQFLTSKKDYEAQYHPDMAKYQWKCGKCDHVWEATANNVKRGSWCRVCQYSLLSRKFRKPYSKIIALAKKVGVIKTGYEGVFLASEDEYNAIRSPIAHKFQWECGKCGNIFKMDIDHVKRPQWCPKCVEGESEQVCRGFFERIFQSKFPKKNPKWLLNPHSEGRMHFDGYNEKLKLAFEFNGPQHYVYYPKYHKKYEDFIEQQERDIIKAELCKKYGIILIVVPYTLKYDEFQDYIIEEYKRLTGKDVKNTQKYDWKTFKRDNLDLTSFL